MSYQLGQLDSDRNEFFADPRDPEARPRSRGLIITAAALSLIAMFAGGLWFAYHQGLRHASVGAADVPLIRADDRPTKVKPEKPGGMEVPDRDKLIYTQKRAAVEHLLPPPEKPMPRPTPPSAHPPRAESAQALAAAHRRTGNARGPAAGGQTRRQEQSRAGQRANRRGGAGSGARSPAAARFGAQ